MLRKSGIEHYLRHGAHGTLAPVTRRNPHEVHPTEHRDVVVVQNKPKIPLHGSFGEKRKQAAEWGKKHIRGEYINNYSGLQLQVVGIGIKEAASHAYTDAELQTISAIPQLIKHSVLFDVSPHEPQKKEHGDVYTFYGIVKQAGQAYLAKIVAKTIGKNKLQYDHQSIEIMMPDVASAASGVTATHQALTPPSGIKSVINLHQLVDYVNALHPEHVESFRRLHKSLRPSTGKKASPQHDAAPMLLKAHVASYQRTTASGAVAYVREHEDSRVRKSGRLLHFARTHSDFHEIRQARFGHLPNWGELSEHDRNKILDAEEEVHRRLKEDDAVRDHAKAKERERQKEKMRSGGKVAAKDLIASGLAEKTPGREVQLNMFKGKRISGIRRNYFTQKA